MPLLGQISKAYQGVGKEKCDVIFLFHIRYFPVTYLIFAVLLICNKWGRVCEDVQDVRVGSCHYKVRFGWPILLL